jgi:hypothetical protein
MYLSKTCEAKLKEHIPIKENTCKTFTVSRTNTCPSPHQGQRARNVTELGAVVLLLEDLGKLDAD